MNTKEILYFCTAILSLKKNKSNILKVEEIILNAVNWELFVAFSTGHYILPALYINLKQANLIHLLPKDLVLFMEDITSQNKVRNIRLHSEVLELNMLLKINNIQAIFLKGSAHLCLNLYSDYAERMIGDIDLLVAPSEMLKVAEILKSVGYFSRTEFNSYLFDSTKHYPRMCHKDKLIAVEIHKEVIQNVRDRQLNYQIINHTKQMVNGAFIPSFENLVLHNAMNTQMNDKHYLFGKLNLRQQYDLFLLSFKVDVKQTFTEFYFHELKIVAYLVKTSLIFKNTPTLSFPINWKTTLVKYRLRTQIAHQKRFKYINALIYFFAYSAIYINLFFVYLEDSKTRKRLLNKFTDVVWIRAFIKRNINSMFSH